MKTKGEELAIMEVVLKSQYMQERLADAACDIYASSCSLSRLEKLLTSANGHAAEIERDVAAGRYFLALANRRIKQNLAALWDNDDTKTTRTANLWHSHRKPLKHRQLEHNHASITLGRPQLETDAKAHGSLDTASKAQR